ncbi:MAG: response regulator [Proteobacteria bacterium]|nr:response regulator [Pseudomonadota bacterium]
MLNDDPGKIIRVRSAPRQDKRGAKVDSPACILIVDPVLGSRFSLAQAVAYPGYVVKAASTVEEALSHLDRGDVSLIIVDQKLTEGDGIEFLVEVRGRYASTYRALVTASQGVAFIRGGIQRAGLSFLVNKPWSPISLRKTVREVLGGPSIGRTRFRGIAHASGCADSCH